MHTQILDIAKAVQKAGGRALLVGGYVRDTLLKQRGYDVEPKDVDIEVFGLTLEELTNTLEPLGTVKEVGKQFQVLLINDIHVSIPRTETRTGKNHTDFKTTARPDFSVKEAAQRRDLTINALYMDPLTKEIIDEVGGQDDLKTKVLRAVNPKTFPEDALRALRVVQFAGRFNFVVEPDTAGLCHSLDLSHLPPERIGEEWLKLLLKAEQPSIGLQVAKDLGILKKLHPELDVLESTEQAPEYHPEGDVWVHTKMVVDEAAKIVRREQLTGADATVIMLTALCHDMGKATTTVWNDEKGRLSSAGHEKESVKPAQSFMNKLAIPSSIQKRVLPLVSQHMIPMRTDATPRAVRRLAARLQPASIQELLYVAEADQRGRGRRWNGFPKPDMGELAKQYCVYEEPEEPLVKGRDLIELGMEPGPELGRIVKELYEAQLEGKFATKEEGLKKIDLTQ